MPTVTLVYAENKPWRYNSNKGVTVFVDGERKGNYWNCSKEFIVKDVKARMGLSRVHTEIAP